MIYTGIFDVDSGNPAYAQLKDANNTWVFQWNFTFPRRLPNLPVIQLVVQSLNCHGDVNYDLCACNVTTAGFTATLVKGSNSAVYRLTFAYFVFGQGPVALATPVLATPAPVLLPEGGANPCS